MSITPLPTPPSRQDPANFSARADAFLAALPTLAEEINAFAGSSDAAALGLTLLGTSASQGSAIVALSTSHTTAGTVGQALNTFSFIFGDGATDKSAALATAIARGRPIVVSGVLVIGTATTISVPIIAPLSQIFTTGSLVTIDNNLPVRPEWWGDVANALDLAINSLPTAGGTVQLENRNYKPNGYAYGFSGVGTGKYISKQNVRIQGRQMPRLSTDCRSLEGGSVIQGTVIAYADNIEFRDLGVDCGKNVLDTYYSGTVTAGVTEGLLLTYPDTDTKAAAATKRNARLHNVIGLAASPSALVHAIIAGEGYYGVTLTGEVTGVYGLHGIAIKCAAFKAEKLTAYLNDGEGVIIKSDAQATAVCTDLQIGSIYVRGAGPLGWSPYATPTYASSVGSLVFQCLGNNIDKVQIGSVNVSGHPKGIETLFSGTEVLSNLDIGSTVLDGHSSVALNLVTATGIYSLVHLHSVIARNSPVGVYASFTNGTGTPSHVTIGSLTTVNSSDVGVWVASQSYVDIGTYVCRAATAGAYRILGTPILNVGTFSRNGTTTVYSSASGGLVPALENAWTQVSGNDAFGVDLLGGRVALRGLIRPGSSNQFLTLPRWAWPATTKRFVAQGYNGTTQVAVPLLVSSTGVCNINEVAGGTANVSGAGGWLSLSGITWDLQA